MGPALNVDGVRELHNDLLQVIQQLSSIYTALNNLAIGTAGNNTFTGANSFTKPIGLPVSTVAALPAVTLTDVGKIAFASNGRNTGEGAGVGTGCLVQVQNKASVAVWCATWSGVAVTS